MCAFYKFSEFMKFEFLQ